MGDEQSLPDDLAKGVPSASKPIPDSFRSSLAAWWGSSVYRDARIAEDRLLRRLNFFEPTPEGSAWSKSKRGRKSAPASGPAEYDRGVVSSSSTSRDPDGLVARLRTVFIPTPDPNMAPQHPIDPVKPGESSTRGTQVKKADYINALEIASSRNTKSKEAVVVLHGYAAATGFYFRNWEAIGRAANSSGRRSFFLDWLGMGLSSRPSPSLMSSPSAAAVPEKVARAEHFFLSSLESWRASAGIEKMVLVGHSLGGYLASAYTVRYPDRVTGLVLLSPAGIPHGPGYKPYKPTGEQNAGDGLDEAVDAMIMELGTGEATQDDQKDKDGVKKESLFMRTAFVWAWEKGISLFSIVRGTGPLSPMLVGKYSNNRFGSQDEEVKRDLHAYFYAISMLKGSGEYCISHLMAPGAYARIPIVDRIDRIKCPVTFVYGKKDWMDVEGGQACEKVLAKAGNANVAVHVVSDAGHHVYLDNPDETNRLIGEAIHALPRITTP